MKRLLLQTLQNLQLFSLHHARGTHDDNSMTRTQCISDFTDQRGRFIILFQLSRRYLDKDSNSGERYKKGTNTSNIDDGYFT